MTVMNWVTGGDRELVRTAMRAEMLARDDEQELAKRWRENGDEAALARLTNAYLRLVVSMATKFRHYGLSVADLIQEGTVGLLEAASRFEPSRDVRFSTYANWWVRAAMQDFVLRNWSIVRTGTTAAHKTLFFNLKRLKAKLDVELDKPLSFEGRRQIAEDVGVREQDILMMEGRLSGVDRSLNAQIGEDGGDEWQDFLISDMPRPDEVVEHEIDSSRQVELLANAMQALNEREQYIIRERRLTDDEGVTLAELGVRLGVSKERVRQLEVQALAKLKRAILETVGDPVEAGLID